MKRGFEYALKNNRLIYGVLAQLNYKVGHPDFEDMFEEARILLAEIYTEYYRKENAKEECGSYMFQKLKWRLLDKLRQKKRKQVEVCFSQLANENDELPQIEEIIETGDNIEISDALYQLYKRCTDNEKMLLSYYSVGITKTTEIARLMAKEIKKSVLYIYGTKEDGDTRRRSYHNLVNNVGAEKLSAFGKIIGELSGEETQDIEIVETSMVKD